jgi:hypothetical protein
MASNNTSSQCPLKTHRDQVKLRAHNPSSWLKQYVKTTTPSLVYNPIHHKAEVAIPVIQAMELSSRAAASPLVNREE